MREKFRSYVLCQRRRRFCKRQFISLQRALLLSFDLVMRLESGVAPNRHPNSKPTRSIIDGEVMRLERAFRA